MDDLVRQKFFDVIKQHGRQVMGDYKSFETLLLEKCGRSQETEALLSAVREGAAFSLMTVEGAEAPPELIQDLVKRLESSGMGAEDAKWAVESLGIALGKIQKPAVNTSAGEEKGKGKKAPLKKPVIAALIVAAVVLVAATAIGIYTLIGGGGHGQDSSDKGQADITPTLSPVVTPTLTPTQGEEPTPTPEQPPPGGTTPEPGGTTPEPPPPSPSGTVRPIITPIKPPPSDLFAPGNTLPNLVNGGDAAVRGGYIYFRNTADGNKLYKKPVNGGDSQKLSDDVPKAINVVGEWVYYNNMSDFNLYKVKTDGSGREKVFNDRMTQPVVILDMVYFIGRDDNALYKRKIGSAASTRLDGGTVSSINPVGSWIYYIKGKDANAQILKVKTDGTGKQRIKDAAYAVRIYIQSNSIFCILSNSHTMLQMNQDGSSVRSMAFLERIGDEMNYDDQWIYYTNLDDNSSLYRVKADGTGKLKLANGLSGLIHTGDGWVFFFAQAKLFMIKPDGTGMTQVR